MAFHSFFKGRKKTILFVRKNRMKLISFKNYKFSVLLTAPVLIGKNGLALKKREGDMKTPIGIFTPRFSFGVKSDVASLLDYIKITSEHYLVDDPESKYYNRLVNVNNVTPDWKSAEHLIDYNTEYAYALDIGYNKNCKKGRGSAVFLHCIGQKSFTAGCIAAPKEAIQICIEKLDKTSKIIILP